MITDIPQTEPRAEYLACREEIDAAIRLVLERGQYLLGPEVTAFEEEFAAYLGAAHAVGVASGTDALELALRACGVGAGDEVITVSHTAVATVAAIVRCGARPVLVDVDPRHYTMAAAGLPPALTPRTKAIVPVHLYGRIADMDAIGSFAREHGLLIVEDCAQCHGAACRAETASGWRKAGTFGDAAAFSFYPTKNLGALGDGGCVVTNRAEVASRTRSLRQYGWHERFVSSEPGMNSRLDELQAAILRVKLRYLDSRNAARCRLAAIYDECLAGTSVRLPVRSPDCEHVFHQYVVRAPRRDQVRAALQAAGVSTAVHYPMPIHRQPAYLELGEDAALANTDRLSGEILSLPMYPFLGEGDARRVVKELRRACSSS